MNNAIYELHVPLYANRTGAGIHRGDLATSENGRRSKIGGGRGGLGLSQSARIRAHAFPIPCPPNLDHDFWTTGVARLVDVAAA